MPCLGALKSRRVKHPGARARLPTMSQSESHPEVEESQEEILKQVVFVPPTVPSPFTAPISSYSYASPVPQCGPVMIGVDEAGRGPVLGPMVYGLCYTAVTRIEDLSAMGFADSKTLKHDTRQQLMEDICATDWIGYEATVMTPTDISAGMLRGSNAAIYNLNAQSHDVTIALIRSVLSKGVDVAEIYVDTVGPPAAYEKKLAGLFPSAKVTVRSKADSLFPIVSAASIVAKVTRDVVVSLWAKELGSDTMGSGYPSDPNTKAWLVKNTNTVFGFPHIVRFSWETTRTVLARECADVQFKSDVLAERNAKGQVRGVKKLKRYFGGETGPSMAPPKHGDIYSAMGMQNVPARQFAL